jgi:hypothetical protein
MPFGEPSSSTTTSKKKRGLGCAGCGCGLLLIIGLLFVALGYSSYHTALKVTNATPAPIAQVDGGSDVYTTAQHKIAAFQHNIEHGQPATLRLNSDEINTYIARDPSASAVRGHLAVKLEGDEATLHSSLPLGAVENVVMADRYADLDATFSLTFDPQTRGITVNAHDIRIKGQPEPDSINPILNQTINAVLAQRIQASASMRDFLAHTQKMTIENGELVIETK